MSICALLILTEKTLQVSYLLYGVTEYNRTGYPREFGRWREKSDIEPTYFQVPLGTMISKNYGRLIIAGRAISADKEAFAAIRVMTCTNQLGEAAGVAAHCALESNIDVTDVDIEQIKNRLREGGSIVV